MVDNQNVYKTLDDILEQPDMPKIIVIGGGGLGKTTLVNKLTHANFNVSHSTKDGTTEFQGAIFNCNSDQILIIDSPGFAFNEEKWWIGILQIKNVVGVIVMHRYEQRNSSYANFGYVLSFLKYYSKSNIKKILLDPATSVEDQENYMYGSECFQMTQDNEIYETVQKWIQQLNLKNPIEIYSPTQLIKLYRDQSEQTRNLEKQMEKDKKLFIERIQVFVEKEKDLEETNKTLIEENENQTQQITDTCTILNEQSGPGWMGYIASALPFMGMYYARSLESIVQKNKELARNIKKSAKKE